MGKYETRLAEMGITLAPVPTPVANYLPFAITGNLVFLAGQVCRVDGKVTHQGKLGAELDVAAGKAAARVCAINLIAALKLALGSQAQQAAGCAALQLASMTVPPPPPPPLEELRSARQAPAPAGAGARHHEALVARK
jgi:hypothetical protein